MAKMEIENVAIRGIATCVPEDINEVSDYTLFSETEKKNFIQTVGVQRRRFAKKGTCASDLGVFATEKLLDALNWEKQSIDAIIMVTQSPDYPIPATAIIMQERLGFANTCLAFDINLGCSGYVIGLQTIASLLGKNKLKRAILIAADVPSGNLSFHDKSTYPLFGDAASATALEYNVEADKMYFISNSDGKDFDALYVPHGGMRNFAGPESFTIKEFEGGVKRNMTHMVLDGMRIFNFSISKVPEQISNTLLMSNASIEETDYFFTHQANKIMNETIRRKLKIPPEKFPYSIDEYGNTSSASIAVTMCHVLGSTKTNISGSCILSGFGIGLSWATAYLKLNSCLILPVSEYEQ